MRSAFDASEPPEPRSRGAVGAGPARGGALEAGAHAADAALRDRILDGDRAAAEALFQRHLEPLYEFCHYRLGGERSATEDVVQDTLLTALEGLGGFDARSSLHTWMCGIAKNKIRALRRRRRPLALDEVLEQSQVEIDSILARIESRDLPDWVLEERETRELVGATLSSLPPDYRAALSKKYIEGTSVREMAAQSGKSEKAVESTLTRARTAFARVFELIARRRGGVA